MSERALWGGGDHAQGSRAWRRSRPPWMTPPPSLPAPPPLSSPAPPSPWVCSLPGPLTWTSHPYSRPWAGSLFEISNYQTFLSRENNALPYAHHSHSTSVRIFATFISFILLLFLECIKTNSKHYLHSASIYLVCVSEKNRKKPAPNLISVSVPSQVSAMAFCWASSL